MRTAWLASALVLLSGGLRAQTAVAQGLDCRGEEPFWRVVAGVTGATLMLPGAADRTVAGSLKEFPYLKPTGLVWLSADDAGGLFLAAREESCSSTMADGPPFSHRVLGRLPGGEAVTGCCNIRKGFDVMAAPAADFATKDKDDWARWTPDLRRAIDKCVAGMPGVLRVTKAWPMNRGKAGVRLETGDETKDCIADQSGRGKPEYRAPTIGMPGTGNPLFYPKLRPPVVACGRLERVNDAGGQPAGWLHYDPCP